MSAALAAVRRLGGVSPARALRVPGRLVLAVPAHLRRRAAVLALLAGILFALYMLVVRDLGVFAVDRVAVTGLSGRDAARATAALEHAGRDSTTLHVDHDAIAAARDRFPTIRSVSVKTDFPSGMRIVVTEQRPAAMLVMGARRIPVSSDGSILTGLPLRGSLPVVKLKPGEVPAKRLTPGGTLDAVRVAGAAPAALTAKLEDVTRKPGKGWVVQVTEGPLLEFGPATSLGTKWAAVTRVLADRDAAGADYIDVRLPGRPAAGGLPVQTMQPVAPAGSDADPVQGVQPGPAQTTPVPPATQPPTPATQPSQP